MGGPAPQPDGTSPTRGPHAFYCDGAPYEWRAERELMQPVARPTPENWAGTRFLHGGRSTATPPRALLRMLADRGAPARHSLIQPLMPVRAGESRTVALARLEGVLDRGRPAPGLLSEVAVNSALRAALSTVRAKRR